MPKSSAIRRPRRSVTPAARGGGELDRAATGPARVETTNRLAAASTRRRVPPPATGVSAAPRASRGGAMSPAYPGAPACEVSQASARDRILDGAVTVFGRRGFRDATVREIASEAGVGLGLMNYHFGDKERLYSTVLDHLFQTAFSRYPLDTALSAKRPPAERLREWVHAILGRLIGDTGLYREDRGGRLLAMEMAHPSPAMDEVIARYLRPQKEALVIIVGALLGAVAKRDPWRLQCCVLSVAAQCLHYAYARPLIARLVFSSSRPGDQLDLLAHHITEFSLGGIRAVGEGRGKP